jgi:SWI/SNF-related matrix-associated actin-dependent regulator of chromatin subfamily A-like protein 1
MKISPISGSPGRFELKADSYSPKLYQFHRQIPGLERIDAKTYRGYRDAMALLVSAWKAAGLRGLDSTALRQLEMPKRHLVPPQGLRAYQGVGADFLVQRGEEGCILGDGMRLGKTAQAIAAMRAIDGRTVIVCPSYVRTVWADELHKWWPELEENDVFFPKGLKGSFDALFKARVVVLHYEILHAWEEALVAWKPDIACADEGHLLQNEETARAKAARKVFAASRYRWALSGTPQTNRVRDLYNLVETVRPGAFGNFFQFGLRYCDAHKEAVTPEKTVWKFDGASNQAELSDRLRSFMLRRIASDPEIALELPKKTRQTIWVDVPAKMAISQATDGRALRAQLDRTADAKLSGAIEVIAGHLDAGLKVVAFCWRRGVVEHCLTTLDGYAREAIMGGVSASRRGKAIDAAAKAQGAFLLAVTIDACSVGIDLSFADVLVFVELTYEPHELLQAEARGVKYGSNKGLLIQYVLGRGTVDEIVASRVVDRLENFEKVIGSSGESLEHLRGKSEDALGEIYAAIAQMGA